MRTAVANHILEAAKNVLADETSDPMAVVWAMAIVQANADGKRVMNPPDVALEFKAQGVVIGTYETPACDIPPGKFVRSCPPCPHPNLCAIDEVCLIGMCYPPETGASPMSDSDSIPL